MSAREAAGAAGWLPLPSGHPGWRRRLVALGLLAASAAGVAATLVVWRADAADKRGDYAAAVRLRPGVALYRRHYGEALLLRHPRQAEAQLLRAVRLNPYDPLTIADLTTVELALGNWPQALNTNRDEARGKSQRRPGFDEYWRLANLFLTHGDLAGYWQQLKIAAPRAMPSAFNSIVSRSLTASGNDFGRLRQALPPDSIAAASAYLSAAVERRDRAAARVGLKWLQSQAAPADAVSAQARRRALRELLEAAWEWWPQEAGTAWRAAAAAGVVTGRAKGTAGALIRDGSFAPEIEATLRRQVPDRADRLSAILGWRWLSPNGVRFDEVLTNDVEHPSAAELIFDGTENDQVELPQQWLLAAGGTQLGVVATARRLENRPEQGLWLRLGDMSGHVIGEMAIPLGNDWRTVRGQFAIPGNGLGTYQLSLHYQRPNGEMPLRNRVLVTGVRAELMGAGASAAASTGQASAPGATAAPRNPSMLAPAQGRPE